MTAPAQGTGTPRLRRRLPLWVAALAVIGIMLLSLVLGLLKPQVTTLLMKLTGASTRTVHFTANQFLFEDVSKVKVAGVDSGVVSSVDPASDGGAIVTVVVDPEVVDTVGDQPSARLRPTTLLSGLFYIDLVPGGDRSAEWTEQIPVDRTRLPTEVDDVAERLQPDAPRARRPRSPSSTRPSATPAATRRSTSSSPRRRRPSARPPGSSSRCAAPSRRRT